MRLESCFRVCNYQLNVQRNTGEASAWFKVHSQFWTGGYGQLHFFPSFSTFCGCRPAAVTSIITTVFTNPPLFDSVISSSRLGSKWVWHQHEQTVRPRKSWHFWLLWHESVRWLKAQLCLSLQLYLPQPLIIQTIIHSQIRFWTLFHLTASCTQKDVWD